MLKYCLRSFIITRVVYIAFTVIVYSSGIIGEYDLSSKLVDLSLHKNNLEGCLLRFLSYFNSYDATLFIYIARHSYTNDSVFAFFSFFPKLIQSTSTMLNLALSSFFINENTTFLLSGFLLSNLLCFGNVVLIYLLTLRLTKSTLHAKAAALLFLINPGTIFFIAIYSENLYLFLSLLFIFTIMNSPGITLYAMVLIIGMNMTRSNSLFLCAYFVMPCLSLFYSKESPSSQRRLYDEHSLRFNLSQCIRIARRNLGFIGKYVIMLLHSYLIFLWMTKFQPRQEICASIGRKINAGSVKYELFEEYCNDRKNSVISSVYSFIQKEYWKVGFMSQYRLDKLDRLLLALPMNILSFYVIWKVIAYFDFKRLMVLDLEGFLFKHKPSDNHDLQSNTGIDIKEYSKTITEHDITYNTFLISSFINFLVLLLVVLLIAHPQINNRQMSTCPLLYLITSEDLILFLSKPSHLKGFLILLFFLCFSLLSCIMQVGCYGFA